MRYEGKIAAAVVIATLSTACDQNPVGELERVPGVFASIEFHEDVAGQGAETITVEGSGHFDIGPDPDLSVPMRFWVLSSGLDEAGAYHGVGIMRYHPEGRPGVGTHDLWHFDVLDGEAMGTLGWYSRSPDSRTLRIWTSTSGTLRVTASSENWVAGEFEFVALECNPRGNCADDPTTVRVTGTFSVPQADETSGVPLPGDGS